MSHLASLVRPLTGIGAVTLLVACSQNPSEEAVEVDTAPAREPVAADEFDYEEYLIVLQRASRVENPPETELVRVVSPDEKPDLWMACMQEAGYDVSVTFDGGLAPPQDLPDDQWEAYDLANYICHAQYPVDQSLFRSFGMEQVDIVYRYYVDELRPCLLGRGFDVGEAPTLETFRASWATDDGGGLIATSETWFPYGYVDLSTMSNQDWEELNLACPQEPSDDMLFGEDG